MKIFEYAEHTFRILVKENRIFAEDIKVDELRGFVTSYFNKLLSKM